MYEIIYSYSDDWCESTDNYTYFTGSYEDMRKFLEQLKAIGCYGFTVSYIDDDGERW